METTTNTVLELGGFFTLTIEERTQLWENNSFGHELECAMEDEQYTDEELIAHVARTVAHTIAWRGNHN